MVTIMMTKRLRKILHVVQRKVVVIVGGEDSGFNLDGQQLR